jgi:hypothetical protein
MGQSPLGETTAYLLFFATLYVATGAAFAWRARRRLRRSVS